MKRFHFMIASALAAVFPFRFKLPEKRWPIVEWRGHGNATEPVFLGRCEVCSTDDKTLRRVYVTFPKSLGRTWFWDAYCPDCIRRIEAAGDIIPESLARKMGNHYSAHSPQGGHSEKCKCCVGLAEEFYATIRAQLRQIYP